MSLVITKQHTVTYNLPPEKDVTLLESTTDNNSTTDEEVQTLVDERSSYSESPGISTSLLSDKIAFYVKDKTFVIDKEFIANVSPLFKIVINSSYTVNTKYGIKKDIVDEKPSDIEIFLKCLQEPKYISNENVALLMRLASKYVVPSLKENCSNFIKNINIQDMSLQVIVNMLRNCLKSMTFDRRFEKLILRIAIEDSHKIKNLKLTHINHKLYGSVMATHFNVLYMRAVENMNGHFFNLEKNKLKYNKYICKICNKIADVVFCVGCKKELCENHWRGKSCESNYGSIQLSKIKENLVDISKD
uniref:BTB domain-containing protein n=1 Tax=Parastrongyloides trichosuri TaxID=131310 RepID=A0A0N5A330_PARTI